MIDSKKTITGLLALIFFINYGEAQVRQGDFAKEIALPTIKGDTLKLSSLKGKVVLLDFWASWCGPCRASNKTLVRLYNKYKSKGFEIYSVSIDDNKGAWERAIRKDKITWLQVNDDKGWDGKVPVAWNIYQIPTSYLIDKEGRLVAMDAEGKELEALLKEMLN